MAESGLLRDASACDHEDSDYDKSGDAESEIEREEDRVGPVCNCKSTCRTKRCPCQSAGVPCRSDCHCGTRRNPCKNCSTAPDGSQDEATESASVLRLQQLKGYVENLTTEQCHHVIFKAFSHRGGIELMQSFLIDDTHEQQQPPQNDPRGLSWCICMKCQAMSLSVENVCCWQLPCVTTTELFNNNVLNTDILSIAIVSGADVLASTPDYTPAGYRKAAYRQWTMWQHGYLGRGNRRVVPSCVVWAVRNKYPAPDGVYLGFKEY